jgi:hypothetical protein|nr:MAG TPA: hypothetical protein [Caudoviricetes sp.]
MGLKKYEIITVGSDKRVRALRSWRVQDRYVNIGDVGGIVYDEKTLSQDGACWLFRGNFNFPGARISGDSIVDVSEAAPDVSGSANLDILGTSAVVGAPVRFSSDKTSADAVVLGASDFEQGGVNYTAGTNWETWKTNSPNYLRTKAPIFMGGVVATLKLGVPGYTVQAYVLDRDGIGLTATAPVNTGEGVTLAVPAGQHMIIRLAKNPMAAIVPDDATAAQIRFTGAYETKLAVVDSRLELNQATSTGVVTIRPGGTYTVLPGAKYPDSVIRGSKVVINATSNKGVRFMSDLSNVNATINATMTDAQSVGTYRNVYNLVFKGLVTNYWDKMARSLIQAYDCDNMVVNPTNFPGLAAMRTAGVPIRFYNCNLNNGRFYHHKKIANTYRDINFDLATADLGKTFDANIVLVSSEVNGMYRAWFAADFGALIESYESVKSLTGLHVTNSYNTTIYADAYFNGAFSLLGTNVFGNAMKHDASNTQNVMAVQGSFNATTAGQTITGLTNDNKLVCVPTPFRINSGKGLTISNFPAGFDLVIFVTDANNKIIRVQGSTSATTVLNSVSLVDCKAYIRFKKVSGDPITPDDVKGVTVTTYNGCKIVNTKATAATIARNVRVEDNATLIDTSVTGTGYFGGNSIIQAPSALVGQLPIEGAAYMSDNAVFAPSVANVSTGISLLEMKDNATFAGGFTVGDGGYNITMTDAARCLGTVNTFRCSFNMHGNSFVAAGSAVASESRGLLVMKDDARIENGSLTATGHITLCGKYKQTANKTWTGKRVIASQDAPTYDDNVKTKYDI